MVDPTEPAPIIATEVEEGGEDAVKRWWAIFKEIGKVLNFDEVKRELKERTRSGGGGVEEKESERRPNDFKILMTNNAKKEETLIFMA